VIVLAGVTMALLFAAAGIVVYHRARPEVAVQSRGMASLLAQCGGGVVWMVTTIVTLRGEGFGYDSGANTLRAPLVVCGFGVWFAQVHKQSAVYCDIFGFI
jgi:hypothetical protein